MLRRVPRSRTTAVCQAARSVAELATTAGGPGLSRRELVYRTRLPDLLVVEQTDAGSREKVVSLRDIISSTIARWCRCGGGATRPIGSAACVTAPACRSSRANLVVLRARRTRHGFTVNEALSGGRGSRQSEACFVWTVRTFPGVADQPDAADSLTAPSRFSLTVSRVALDGALRARRRLCGSCENAS